MSATESVTVDAQIQWIQWILWIPVFKPQKNPKKQIFKENGPSQRLSQSEFSKWILQVNSPSEFSKWNANKDDMARQIENQASSSVFFLFCVNYKTRSWLGAQELF